MAMSEFSSPQLAEIFRLGCKTVQRIVENDDWQGMTPIVDSAILGLFAAFKGSATG